MAWKVRQLTGWFCRGLGAVAALIALTRDGQAKAPPFLVTVSPSAPISSPTPRCVQLGHDEFEQLFRQAYAAGQRCGFRNADAYVERIIEAHRAGHFQFSWDESLPYYGWVQPGQPWRGVPDGVKLQPNHYLTEDKLSEVYLTVCHEFNHLKRNRAERLRAVRAGIHLDQYQCLGPNYFDEVAATMHELWLCGSEVADIRELAELNVAPYRFAPRVTQSYREDLTAHVLAQVNLTPPGNVAAGLGPIGPQRRIQLVKSVTRGSRMGLRSASGGVAVAATGWSMVSWYDRCRSAGNSWVTSAAESGMLAAESVFGCGGLSAASDSFYRRDEVASLTRLDSGPNRGCYISPAGDLYNRGCRFEPVCDSRGEQVNVYSPSGTSAWRAGPGGATSALNQLDCLKAAKARYGF